MAFLLGDARAANPEGRQRADMVSRLESKIKPGYIANGSIGSDRPQTEYERTDLSWLCRHPSITLRARLWAFVACLFRGGDFSRKGVSFPTTRDADHAGHDQYPGMSTEPRKVQE
jgi:hypothetical protein